MVVQSIPNVTKNLIRRIVQAVDSIGDVDMAKLDPAKLRSYMQQAQDDDDIASPDDETEGGEDYLEEATEDLGESGATGDYEGFMRLMFENAGDLQQAASKVFLSVIDQELPEDTKEEIQAALAEMPQELVAGIKSHLGELDPDQLHDLVEELEDAGAIENDASVVPFLYWAARLS